MTLKECVEKADAFRPNTFTNEQKTAWVNEMESLIQNTVWLRPVELYESYTWADDQNTELLAVTPYDRMYLFWLMAQISFARQEYEEYQNAAEMAEDVKAKYTVYFAGTFHPAQYEPEEREYIYQFGGCWAVKGTTFSVEFTGLPVEADDAASCAVIMKMGGVTKLTYEKTDAEMEYEDTTCTVTVPTADSATLDAGVLRISIVITDGDGKVYESYPPEIVRIRPSAT